jgi:FkbM family methyltransferase
LSLSLKHRVFRAGIGAVEWGIGKMSRDAWLKTAVVAVESMDLTREVNTPRGLIKFWCDSETSRIRARGMLIREPETLRWIEDMTSNDVFLDIGCNVGVFTLYAAVAAKARVIALDPLPFNISGLVRNARLNQATDRISAFCVAMTDRTRIADLQMIPDASVTGGAGSTFDQPIDNYGIEYEPEYRLATMGFSLDDFFEFFRLPIPTHLKMDIDGMPQDVLSGGRAILSSPTLRQAMCEIPPGKEAFEAFVDDMKRFGFRHDRTVAASPNQGADIERFSTNNFFSKT